MAIQLLGMKRRHDATGAILTDRQQGAERSAPYRHQQRYCTRSRKLTVESQK
jgi:hypothetical protein